MQLPAYREDHTIEYVAGSLIVSVFFIGAAGGVAFPTLPRLGVLLGLSPLIVGLIVSMHGVTRLVVNTPVGSLLDSVGTRRPMVAGFLMLGIAPFGYTLGMVPWLMPRSASLIFLVSRAAWGVGTALATIGGFATITHATTTENRGRWLGYLWGAYGLGLPAGLVVGGVVADAFSVQEAFMLAGTLGILATLIAIVVLPDVTPAVERTVGLGGLPALVRTDRRVAYVSTVNAVNRFLTGVFLSTMVLYTAKHEIAIGGLSESGVSGVILGVSVLCASMSNVVVGRYSDSVENRIRVIIPALITIAIGFVLVALVPTLTGIMVGVTIAGLGAGAVAPPLLAYLGDISPTENIGKLGGVYKVFGDVGTILGPIVALPLGSTIGFAGEYLVCAGLVALTALFVGGRLLSVPVTSNPELTGL